MESCYSVVIKFHSHKVNKFWGSAPNVVPVFNNMCFPDPLVIKNLPASAGDVRDAGSVFGSG